METRRKKKKMKIGLPIKLAIFVLILFALVITAMLLWKPVKVKYYAAKLHSDNIKVRQHAARILLEFETKGPKDQTTNRPVFDYYTDRYDPKSVEKRMAVVDELCEVGDKGKAVMKEIFRNWCYSPSQQVKIPAGSFMMGSEDSYWSQKPVHEVSLDKFHMDKYEVTNEKYVTFLSCVVELSLDTRQFPRNLKLDSYLKSHLLLPVVNISWFNAKSYAHWLGMKLPTEAQWEYACRAGSTGVYYFGDNKSFLGEYAWCGDINSSRRYPYPVGGKKPNRWGLFDMLGNVNEWCRDWSDDYYYANSPKKNPTGPQNGESRVVRGGAWCTFSVLSKSATRQEEPPNPRERFASSIGFRCVRDAE
jgi:formylglycine-generating enzyme required for sulfatase activity